RAKSSWLGSPISSTAISSAGRPKPRRKSNGRLLPAVGARTDMQAPEAPRAAPGKGLALAEPVGRRLRGLPAEQRVLVVVAGALVVGDVAANQRIVRRGAGLTARAARVVVAAHALARAEDRQVLAVEQPQMLVVADQRAAPRG